jgi:manganese/zinc/iron transport system permease protein
MTSAQFEIQLIASLVAIACAIPGTFLVLRKMAMISDAISHSILPGIVVGFFITQDLNSPWLILFAALTGVLTVVLVEKIQQTKLVKEDTAIGLVFPALFSIGVIMIAKFANDVHLDIDAVLLGELAFSPFDRVYYGGVDLGPKSLLVTASILLMTLLLLVAFFKELKLSTFDAGLATSLGFSPAILHYGLMSVASVTTVGAFDAVGAILVVALMIAPAASAYLLTNDLKKMLSLACLFGVFSAISGYWVAHSLDASIAGSITTVLGIVFLMVYLFAPSKGLIAVLYREKQQKIEVFLITFLLHLKNHNELEERHVKHLNEHINWQKVRSKTVLQLALKNNMITISNQVVSLTQKGEAFTSQAIEYIITNENVLIEDMKDDFFLFRG